MKRNQIISALLTFVLVFLLIATHEKPVYAVNSSELGIWVSKPKRSYNNENGKYSMEITIRNTESYIFYVSAYLYNADGKRVIKWDNNGDCYTVYPGGEKTMKFSANYAKYQSSSYTFVYQVRTSEYLNRDKYTYEKPVFKWKWNISSQDASGPSITFKKTTLSTLKNGTVAPRINYNCRNMKGQTLNIYIYDEDGEVAFKAKLKKRASNNEKNYVAWNGKSGRQQYPDGNYTVKLVSSGGLSVSKKLYLDFQYNNK